MIGVGAANLLGPGKQLTLSKDNALKVLSDFACIYLVFKSKFAEWLSIRGRSTYEDVSPEEMRVQISWYSTCQTGVLAALLLSMFAYFPSKPEVNTTTTGLAEKNGQILFVP